LQPPFLEINTNQNRIGSTGLASVVTENSRSAHTQTATVLDWKQGFLIDFFKLIFDAASMAVAIEPSFGPTLRSLNSEIILHISQVRNKGLVGFYLHIFT